MGCCLIAESKDDFKGYRIVKGKEKKFEVKKYGKTNINKEIKKGENNQIIQNPNIINPRKEIINNQINKTKIKTTKKESTKLFNSNIKNKLEEYNIIENFRYNNNQFCETREFFTHKDFIKGEIKGKGRFGIVYSGLCSNSGEIVAIKIYDNISKEKIENICDNIKDLYYLNHPNLIRAIPLIDSCNLINFNHKEYFSIIYEISNGDSLKDLINKFGELSEIILQKYSFDILQGLQYLHIRKIFENSNKYFKVGKFYLFVVREEIPEKNTSENVNDFDIIYMRVSMKSSELILIESFIQSEYFYTNYNEQFYYYNHLSIDLPFSLSLTLYYGKIDIYIDFKEITKERVNNSKNQYFYLKHFNVEKSDYIKISSESIKEHCLYSNNCPIYIYIKKVGEQNVKFDIIALSRTDEPILLNQGKLIRYEIHVNEKQKYIIKDIPEEIDGKVMIRFEEGDGRVYMTFQCEEEDKDNHLWQAETDFYGKILKVPSYKTLDTADLTCYYSIYIIGTDNSFKSFIKYTIIYNYYADEITLNEPIKSHIKTGEIHYYTFSIDENENSLYISLYCSEGDSDLYVNYGKTLPTTKEYNWFSSNPQFDYVQINKNDNYFISNGLSNIGGIYTLMIYGFIESSYSLFVTSHPKKIIPLNSNSPSICQSKGKNEIDCFFRFDNLITSSEIDDIDIVFSVNFIYGVGDIFVNLVNNIEGDIFNKFPSRKKSDYSNTQRNKRNFLKIHIEKTHYKLTRNSILLIGVDCLESCFFEINSAILEKNKLYHYLDVNRQNLFYLEKNSNPFILTFYKTKELNLNYEINTYTGEAEVLVYQNISTYNEKSKNYSYEYVHLGSTLITKNNPYYNFIIHHKKDLNQKIYFKITPKQNIGFYIQLNYESEWTRVPIGKEITYQVTKNIFNGYFDLFEEYNSTILSVRCNDEKAKATIFSTINIYKRNAQNTTDKTNPFNFLIPDNKNAQYKGTTDPITRSVSIKIKNVNFDDIDDDGNVRVLFSIHLKYNESNSDNIDKSISIIISPFVNYYKRIEVYPLSLYYSSDEFYIK
jgi:hypothetical protein